MSTLKEEIERKKLIIRLFILKIKYGGIFDII